MTTELLLVERNDAYRYVLARRLRASGIAVVEVGMALDTNFQLGRNAGIKMAVVHLGSRSGYGLVVARAFRDRDSEAKVVLMSSRAERDRASEMASGFGDVLLKTDDLVAMVREIRARLGLTCGNDEAG
jgi:DNA-binding response OmpR family regulator